MPTRFFVHAARLSAALFLFLGLGSHALAQKVVHEMGPLGKRLSANSLLHRLKYEVIEVEGSFTLLIPLPAKDPAVWVQAVRESYEPWLAKIDYIFIRNFRDPLQLESRDPAGKNGPNAVVILENQRSYNNVKRQAGSNERYEDFAVRMQEQDLVISFHDSLTSKRPVHWKRYPVLRGAMLNLFEGHASAPEKAMKEKWLIEGLATYLTAHGAGGPEQLDTPVPHAASVKLLTKLAEAPAELDGALLTLGEMIRVRGQSELIFLMRMSHKTAGVRAPDAPELEKLFHAQAALWAHFLMQGSGGAHAAGLGRYFKAVLSGEGGEALLADRLGLEDLSSVDAPFRAYLGALLGDITVAGAAPPEITTEPGAPRRVVTPELIVEATDAEGYLALALGETRMGRMGDALATLAAGQQALGSAEGSARLEREAARITTLRTTRDAFLTALAGSKRRLQVELVEGKISARVSRMEDGVLHLEKNKSGYRQLTVTDITPRVLIANVGKDVADYGPAWVRPYALLVAGDGRWQNYLREDSSETRELKADGEGDMPRLLMYGEAAARLKGLAFLETPVDKKSADSLLFEVRSLLERHGPVRPVDAKLAHLGELAKKALSVSFEAGGIEGLLAGKIEKLSGDRVRITYGFDSAAETADFEPDPEYLRDRRNPSFQTLTPEKSRLGIKAGTWEGKGTLCYRHILPLQAPMSVRYELLYGQAQKGKGLMANISVGICDDAQGSYIMGIDLFHLEMVDRATGTVRTAYDKKAGLIKAAKTYPVELRHDGVTVSLWVSGKKVKEIEANPLVNGRMFLMVHSEVLVAIKSVKIEGHATAEMLAAARDRYVAGELQRMGLAD